MAKAPMVTRTITTIVCKVLCLNVESGESEVKEIAIPRTYKDEKAMLKVITKMNDDENIKAVHIKGYEVKETLYGMTESKFIELADKLPARAIKTENE